MFAGDGEPLLNPEIANIVDSAHRHSIDSSFTTNGVLLKDEFVRSSLAKITWIKVSLNAGLADDYSAVHRTSRHDFETVWSSPMNS